MRHQHTHITIIYKYVYKFVYVKNIVVQRVHNICSTYIQMPSITFRLQWSALSSACVCVCLCERVCRKFHVNDSKRRLLEMKAGNNEFHKMHTHIHILRVERKTMPLNCVSLKNYYLVNEKFSLNECGCVWVCGKRMNAHSLSLSRCHISHYRMSSWVDTVTTHIQLAAHQNVLPLPFSLSLPCCVSVCLWIYLDFSSRLCLNSKCFYYVCFGWGVPRFSFFLFQRKKTTMHTLHNRIKYIKDLCTATNRKHMWYVFKL